MWQERWDDEQKQTYGDSLDQVQHSYFRVKTKLHKKAAGEAADFRKLICAKATHKVIFVHVNNQAADFMVKIIQPQRKS